MTDFNNIDVFKLAEEVDKQNKKVNIDDIFRDLDSVKFTDAPQKPQAKTQFSSTATDPGLVSKPKLPNDVGSFDTRFEAFRNLIQNVNYGTTNLNSYVEGHRDALEKYFSDAYNNSQDLYLVEARVNDEINRCSDHSQLYTKGYYDGLVYVLKALKRSKEVMMARINTLVMNNL